MKRRILKVKAWLKLGKPDYEGFASEIEAFEKHDIPYGTRQLIILSERYNIPVPRLERGELVFNVETKDFIKK